LIYIRQLSHIHDRIIFRLFFTDCQRIHLCKSILKCVTIDFEIFSRVEYLWTMRSSKFNCIRFVSQSPFDAPGMRVCDTDSARPLNRITWQRKRIASHSRNEFEIKSRRKKSAELALREWYGKPNCVKI